MNDNRYEIYMDTAGYWRWRLIAGRYGIIATSHQGFETRQHCLDQIGLVMRAANSAIYDVTTNPVTQYR